MTDKAVKYLSDCFIHSYDNIDASIVWAILKNHLPILKKEVDKILTQ